MIFFRKQARRAFVGASYGIIGVGHNIHYNLSEMIGFGFKTLR
jgi:hypothetical protein